MSDAAEPRPARPLQSRVEVDQSGKSLRLSYRRRECGGGCFLILWLIGWTVGCVFLAGLVISEPKLFYFLFALPFWASWLFVFAMLLRMFFQREEFSLGPGGAAFMRRVFVTVERHETPLEEIKRFGIFERLVDDESRRMESGIEMQTLGRPLEFAAGLTQPEVLWLEDLLQRQLEELRERFQIKPPANDTANGVAAGNPPEKLDRRFDSDPPSDCSWRREADFDSVTLCQSGRLSLSTVAGVLFLNVFWNGIVSVFVCVLFGVGDAPPPGGMWWGLLVFLIPFEVIGLMMFGALVFLVLEPARRTTWRIGRGDIECRLTWLGLGRTWSYTIERLDRIEVKSKEVKQAVHGPQVSLPWKSADARFRLSLVDRSNDEVCSIDNLTEGESRWIADVIRRERPNWFR